MKCTETPCRFHAGNATCNEPFCRVAPHGSPLLYVNHQPVNVFTVKPQETTVTLQVGYLDQPQLSLTIPAYFWHTKRGSLAVSGQTLSWYYQEATDV
jgi:hypothetical protein